MGGHRTIDKSRQEIDSIGLFNRFTNKRVKTNFLTKSAPLLFLFIAMTNPNENCKIKSPVKKEESAMNLSKLSKCSDK